MDRMIIGGSFWGYSPRLCPGKRIIPGCLGGLCSFGKDICIDSGRQERVDFVELAGPYLEYDGGLLCVMLL